MSDQRDLVLKAPLGQAIWRLAWPLALSNQLSTLTLGVLVFWLGRLAGDTGLAVESLFRPLELLLAWLFGATSVGASVLVSRSVGAADGRGLTLTAASITLTAVLWLVAAAIVAPLAPWLAIQLSGGLAVTGPMLQYALAWVLVALPLLSVAEVVLEVASATGATKFNLVRVLLDLAFMAALTPLLMQTAGLGLVGAPISQGVAAAGLTAIVWVAIVRGRATLGLGDLAPGAWRVRWSIWKEVLAIGLPVQLGRVASFAVQLILVERVARDGEASVAGYGIAGMLLLFGAMMTLALAQAAGIAIGQALGAKALDRARQTVPAALITGWAVMAVFVLVTLVDRPIITLFTDDPAISDAADHALAILRWGAFGIATWQILLNCFAAHRATVRAGLVMIAGEGIGLLIALAWPGSYLDAACYSLAIVSVLKGVLLLGLAATGILERARRRTD